MSTTSVPTPIRAWMGLRSTPGLYRLSANCQPPAPHVVHSSGPSGRPPVSHQRPLRRNLTSDIHRENAKSA
jgi:hypothetical protein